MIRHSDRALSIRTLGGIGTTERVETPDFVAEDTDDDDLEELAREAATSHRSLDDP